MLHFEVVHFISLLSICTKLYATFTFIASIRPDRIFGFMLFSSLEGIFILVNVFTEELG